MAAYANQASVLWLDGTTTVPSITAFVLLARKFALTPPIIAVKDMDLVTVPAPSGATVTLPFTMDLSDETRWNRIWERSLQLPLAWDPGNGASFSVVVSDAMGGTLFRSPYSPTLPPGVPADPNGYIDILVPPKQITPLSQINSDIATRVNNGDFNNPPQDPTSVVTDATAELETGSIKLTVNGTRSSGGFMFILRFAIEPTVVPFYLDYDAQPLVALPTGPTDVLFTPGPGGGLETFLLNLFNDWLKKPLTDTILSTLTRGLVMGARSAAAQAAGIPGAGGQPPTLPASVVLSLRRILITQTGAGVGGPGVHAWGAIGSFGNLQSNLFPGQPSPGTGTCAVMATLLPLISGGDHLPALRQFRDSTLQATPWGRQWVASYYRHNDEVAAVLLRHPLIALQAARAVRLAGADLRARGHLSTEAMELGVGVLQALLPHASTALCRDLELVLRPSARMRSPMAHEFIAQTQRAICGLAGGVDDENVPGVRG